MSSSSAVFPVSSQRQSLSRSARRVLFVVSFLATLVIVVTLMRLNEPLQNGTAPQGVVSFELARTLDRQGEVLASWKEPERLRLAFSIGLDFLFVPAFIATLTLACMWLADVSSGGGNLRSRLGNALRYTLLTMSLFWIAQNALMAGALFGHGSSLTAPIIYWCALFKFAVMGVSSAYILLDAGMQVIARPVRRVASSG